MARRRGKVKSRCQRLSRTRAPNDNLTMTMHAANLQDRLADSGLRSVLLRHAKRSLPTADAEDVVQQALCDAMAARRQPGQNAEVAPWLMTILKRRICDWFRAPRAERFEE